MNLMEEAAVYQAIKLVGTKITTIKFLKADGTIRTANGLFKPVSHIVGSERGVAQGEAMKAKGLVPFYDLKKSAWISFYANKVVEMSNNNKEAV